MAFVLIPAAIVLPLDLGIDFVGGHTYEKVKGEIPESDVAIQLTANEFNWNSTYPAPDSEFGTTDDLTLESTLHVPVGKPVRVNLRSEDVIHSFFVPVLRLKQDVVPGQEIPTWFEIAETGAYEIACTEQCGFGHSGMRGFLLRG